MRPLGRPPTPRARSIAREPVESVSTFIFWLLPSRMIEPSPNCFVMEERASSMFFSRTCETAGTAGADLAGAALDMAMRELRIAIKRDVQVARHAWRGKRGGKKCP